MRGRRKKMVSLWRKKGVDRYRKASKASRKRVLRRENKRGRRWKRIDASSVSIVACVY